MKNYILGAALAALFAAPALAHTSGFTNTGSANSAIQGGSASGAIGNSEAQGFSDSATTATSMPSFLNNGATTSTTGNFDSGAKTSGRAGSVSTGFGSAAADGNYDTFSQNGW